MSSKQIFMETTAIQPLQTAGEIVSLLVRSGAREISQIYNDKQQIVGVKFILEAVPGIFKCFTLPVKSEPVFRLINGRRNGSWAKSQNSEKDRLQAGRVAWRQLFRWCQAQLAMIEVGMVQPAEVYLPWMNNDQGRTVFELMQESTQKQISEKSEVTQAGEGER